MLGVIIGDIVGSRYKLNNIKSKEFEFLTYECCITDNSVISLAIAKAIIECNKDYENLENKLVEYVRNICRVYSSGNLPCKFR